jgi:hypothetical protein
MDVGYRSESLLELIFRRAISVHAGNIRNRPKNGNEIGPSSGRINALRRIRRASRQKKEGKKKGAH